MGDILNAIPNFSFRLWEALADTPEADEMVPMLLNQHPENQFRYWDRIVANYDTLASNRVSVSASQDLGIRIPKITSFVDRLFSDRVYQTYHRVSPTADEMLLQVNSGRKSAMTRIQMRTQSLIDEVLGILGFDEAIDQVLSSRTNRGLSAEGIQERLTRIYVGLEISLYLTEKAFTHNAWFPTPLFRRLKQILRLASSDLPPLMLGENSVGLSYIHPYGISDRRRATLQSSVPL
jgi:hypothetical protein